MKLSVPVIVMVGLSLSACADRERVLTYAQVEVLGIRASAGGANPQPLDLTLGYQGVSFANVPTAPTSKGPSNKEDALSTFGVFTAQTAPGSGTTSIGNSVATGTAAQIAAEKTDNFWKAQAAAMQRPPF